MRVSLFFDLMIFNRHAKKDLKRKKLHLCLLK